MQTNGGTGGAGSLLRVSDLKTDTPLTILASDGAVQMSVNDVLQWVAPNAPPGEALKFLVTCQTAGVNPLMGEAHLIDHGGRWTTIVDKSGWLKKAQSHPAYAGHQAGIIVQQFDPATNARGAVSEVEGAFLPPGHVVIGGWAKIHRKDRPAVPMTMRVSIHEYKKESPTWKSITCTMIRKVALVQALRESGLISTGWYDPAEGPASFDVSQPPPADQMPAIEVAYSEVEDATIKPGTLARLMDLIARSGMTAEQVKAACLKRGVESPAGLTNVQAHEMILKLGAHVDRVEIAANPDIEAFQLPDAPRRPGPEQSPPSPDVAPSRDDADEPANLLATEPGADDTSDVNVDATFDPSQLEMSQS
jgi:phage recombination protein Bet